MDPAHFPDLLGDFHRRFTIDVLPVCESTNALLLERAEQGAPSGAVIIAERQTAGRGSRGRSWAAHPGKSLAFSVLWHFQPGLERLAGLSLAVGVAVARALRLRGARRVSLKWPNDILSDNAKLGGILIDLQEQPDYAFAVIGIGINLGIPGDTDFSGFSLPPAGLDSLLSPLPDAQSLLASLLIGLVDVLDIFSVQGFAPLCDEWRTMNAWQDRPVRLLRGDIVEKEGICRGADNDGALLVQTKKGIERCLSGDLSLRAL